jgi:hypothetical protein
MMQEIELARLLMADSSNLVLTNQHVYQRTNRGWIGQTNVIIPRAAITTVKLEWRRSLALLNFGLVLLMVSVPLQFLELPFSVPYYVAPALAVLGVALILLSIVKSKVIQVMAPSAAIGGTPRNYDDAQRFCSLILSAINEQPPSGAGNEKTAANKRDAVNSQWHL